MLFRNFYRCATCGHEWTDVWSAQCDDDCPRCGARHMSPYKSEDAEEGDDRIRSRFVNRRLPPNLRRRQSHHDRRRRMRSPTW